MYLRRVRLAPSRDHAITVENISERVSVSGRIDCVGCSTNELVEPNSLQETYGKNHFFDICFLLLELSILKPKNNAINNFHQSNIFRLRIV